MTGAAWLAWRNNRQTALIGGGLAAAAAAALVAVAVLETTEPTTSVHILITASRALLIAAPAVAGVFFAAPLFSSDFERGTHRLIWTQGITRKRWAAVSLSMLMVLSALAAAARAAGGQIWIAHLPSTAGASADATWEIYDVQAPVVFAYVLFGMALGAAAGAALRRTVPAMATTLGVFIAVRVAFATLARPHLLPTVSSLVMGNTNWTTPNGTGFVDVTYLDSHLRPVDPLSAGPNAWVRMTYQPPGHFWPMQGIEAGIFVILAAVLVLAAFRLATRDG